MTRGAGKKSEKLTGVDKPVDYRGTTVPYLRITPPQPVDH